MDRADRILRKRRSALLLPAVLLLCGLLYGIELGEVAFLGKDEPKNAQAAREMLERDDWVLTTIKREPWYDKPILYYWTAMIGYKLFGLGELAARIGPAIAAFFTVWLTFVLGRRYLGDASGGALAALVLGTGVEFWILARMAVTDSLLTLFITGSLVGYALAREGVRPGLNLNLAWASAAMATLAKGPVGIVIPAMVVAADLALARDWRGMLRLRWLTGPILFLGIALPWYALATIRSDWMFFFEFILHKNVERFATENLPHPGPFYYYLPVLLLGPFPWSVFLPTAVAHLVRSFRTLPDADRAHVRLLSLWVGLPLIFFSMAGSKLPSYLLPTFPALAILLAREIRRLLRLPGERLPAALTAALVVFALVSTSLAGALLFYVTNTEESLLPAALPVVGVLLGTALAAAASMLGRRRRLAVAWVGACAVLAPITLLHYARGPLEREASAKEIALMAMDLEPEPGRLTSFRFYDNSFHFYTDARVERFYRMPVLVQRVQRVGSVLCFVRDENLVEVMTVPEFIAVRLGTVGEYHLLRLTNASGSPPAE